MRKTVSGVMLTLLLIGMLALSFNIQPVKASGTIYIRADGSIDPPTAPITTVDNVTYTFTGNVNDSIVVERDSIMVDGQGYTVEGTGSGKGFYLSGMTNVTIKNTNIRSFSYGISLFYSSNNSMVGNSITNNEFGIDLSSSSNNSMVGNNITANNQAGIDLASSDNNSVGGNNIANNYNGIHLYESYNNSIFGNNIANNSAGIDLSWSSNNSIAGNNITANNWGIGLYSSSNNSIVGNTFTNDGLFVWGSYGNSFEDNTVNGRPLIYLEGVSNYTVDDAGQVVLARCENIRVEGLNLSRTSVGVELWETKNSTIVGNSITANNEYGISLYESYNNSIVGNSITNNGAGIDLSSSSNNSMVGNNITANNGDGIYLEYSSNNSISGNNITNNSNGISLSGSNNSIAGNNIRNNGDGIRLSFWSSNNSISGNNITNNSNGIYLERSLGNSISGNNITNNYNGISLYESYNNSISGNNITNNDDGINLDKSSNNSISENNITANNWYGIFLGWSSNYNSIAGNNITNNWCGIRFYESSNTNNVIFHNNFIDNVNQVWYTYGYLTHWDDGYPSGGNYWSDYTGIDIKKGADQNQTGSDGIGDTPYNFDVNNTDRYPLMIPWPWPEHELVVSITAPASLQLGSSSSLDAIVTNQGLNDEVNVVLSLFINGTKTNSTTIPLLQPWNSYSLSYLWTPTVEGTYNVTAYATPVPGETSVENNQETAFIRIVQVGVEAGDWIKIDYTITGAPPGTTLPLWLKVEFLSVEGTNATVRVTMRMSDGTEQNATVPVDVVAGGQAFGLSGFVIPANLTTGDIVFMSGYGNVTIEGETPRTYAGASRTVVYASFSQYGTQLTYYWDKQTGVMVEASVTSGTMTGTGKATETNMWQAAPAFPIDPLILSVLIAIVIVIVIAIFLLRRKKKTPEEVAPAQS